MTLVLPECPYFAINEFAVSRSHPELVEPVPPMLFKNVARLVRDVLWPLRERLKVPLVIDSCYRPTALNNAVGGSPTSQHRFAEAADVSGPPAETIYRELWAWRPPLPIGQVILYRAQSFCHIALPSTRYPRPAFFIATAHKEYVKVVDDDALEVALA